MASFETDIHALIEDINGDYGEAQCELRPLVSSRPHSNSDQPQTGPLADPRQRIAPIYSQQPPLYTAQASNPHDTHISGFHDETGLDAYGTLMQSNTGGLLLIPSQTEFCWLNPSLKADGTHAVASTPRWLVGFHYLATLHLLLLL